MKEFNRKNFVPARRHVSLSSGDVIRNLRELKQWTQRELAERSGLTISNISLLENDKVEIGKRRAESLAKAFEVHSALITFPEYDIT
jgi:transcriptional regulator with XRE-family HTH domain